MAQIIKDNPQSIMTKDVVDALTKTVLELPQADCPVAHYFGPGTYIRQVTFPAGIFAIGHKQRYPQMNIFTAGRVAMVQEDGTLKELRAPMIFNGGPGQKMGIVLETVTWLNIYPNPDDIKDIDYLENYWLDKSGPWDEKEKREKDKRREDRQSCRNDYQKFLDEVGLTEDEVRRESEFEDDLIDMPEGFSSVITVRKSSIEGKGIFVSWPFESGSIIGPVRIGGKRTPLGRYLNHSGSPNAKFIEVENGDIILIALHDIAGCRGGDQGTEITVDYRESYKLRAKQCQEQ